MWANCLDSKLAFNEEWSEEEVVYFEHGMEFKEKSKGVNVFLKDAKSWDNLAKKAMRIQNFAGKLFSLDIDCPDYGERLKCRVRPHSSRAYKQLDFDKISAACATATTLQQSDLRLDSLVLGDSHALAAWQPGAYLERLDGQTLNGAVTCGFSEWIDKFASPANVPLKTLRTYFGNIDIRHHVCRLTSVPEEQKALTLDLVDRYVTELLRCKEQDDLDKVEVVATLAIENESRRLPKTGYYKGEPFWGSWAQRDRMHKIFNAELRERSNFLGFDVIEWPDYFLNSAKELDFSVMERPRSVHISPEHYMWSI
jgi:hypothetical protein